MDIRNLLIFLIVSNRLYNLILTIQEHDSPFIGSCPLAYLFTAPYKFGCGSLNVHND